MFNRKQFFFFTDMQVDEKENKVLPEFSPPERKVLTFAFKRTFSK